MFRSGARLCRWTSRNKPERIWVREDFEPLHPGQLAAGDSGRGLLRRRVRDHVFAIMLSIVAATEADIATIRDLAHRIWHAHYPGIITVAQIDYMLARFFASDLLRRDLQAGPRWELARLDDRPVGFLCCVWDPKTRCLQLSKLYLLSELHGRGLGKAMLAHVIATARRLSAQDIRLTVNRNNHKAIRAYQRAGFRVLREVVADIGEGFVMDDYEMGLSLARTAVP